MDLARELGKLWNMKGNGDINCNWRIMNEAQRLAKGTQRVGNCSTIQTTALRSAIILRRVQGTPRDWLSLRIQWKTTRLHWCEKFTGLQDSNNNDNNRIRKSDLTDKMKCSFFQAAVVSILLYGYTTWTLTKLLKKKLDSNYTRMLRAILNKSWRQHPTRHQLYGHLPPITKTI